MIGRRLLAGFLFLSALPAWGNYFTYSQWQALPPRDRARCRSAPLGLRQKLDEVVAN
jgi:hypothetical protein